MKNLGAFLIAIAVAWAAGAAGAAEVVIEGNDQMQYSVTEFKVKAGEKVKLTFTDEALAAVAEKASTRKAGARGLRTILEKVMLDIMFDIPSEDNIREVVITEGVITKGEDPVVEPVRDYGVPG